MTCLNISTIGIYTMDDSIRQLIYTYTGFRSIAIHKDIAPLRSITGTMKSNIIAH